MIYACKNGRLNIVQWCSTHFNIVEMDWCREAVQYGHFEIGRWLLRRSGNHEISITIYFDLFMMDHDTA